MEKEGITFVIPFFVFKKILFISYTSSVEYGRAFFIAVLCFRCKKSVNFQYKAEEFKDRKTTAKKSDCKTEQFFFAEFAFDEKVFKLTGKVPFDYKN